MPEDNMTLVVELTPNQLSGALKYLGALTVAGMETDEDAKDVYDTIKAMKVAWRKYMEL